MNPRDSEPKRPGTVGDELEHVRLEHRARQLEQLLEHLRRRTRASDAGVVERTGLHRALADFAGELDHVRAELGRYAAGGSATPTSGKVSPC